MERAAVVIEEKIGTRYGRRKLLFSLIAIV